MHVNKYKYIYYKDEVARQRIIFVTGFDTLCNLPMFAWIILVIYLYINIYRERYIYKYIYIMKLRWRGSVAICCATYTQIQHNV